MKRKTRTNKMITPVDYAFYAIISSLLIIQMICHSPFNSFAAVEESSTVSEAIVEVGVAPGEDSNSSNDTSYGILPQSSSSETVIVESAPTIVGTTSSTTNIIYAPGIEESKEITVTEPNTNETVAEETQVATKSYTDEDLQYMIMVLTGECQNRSAEVQKKYGSVVLNRVASPKFPNTVKEVCLQKHQYSCFRNGLAYRTPTADTIEAATWLLENGSVYPEYVIFQSRGKQGKGVYEVVQGEYFCY